MLCNQDTKGIIYERSSLSLQTLSINYYLFTTGMYIRKEFTISQLLIKEL